jgi:hypothetical protein
MFSPFEELEYLSDFLPEEGESVLITREAGELVCRPCSKENLRDGIDDPELYGMLVHANERLHALGALPMWAAVITLFLSSLFVHGVLGISFSNWYLIPALSVPLFLSAVTWKGYRQSELFRREIAPQLNREMIRRGIRPYSLMAGVRQHCELKTVLDELMRWIPMRAPMPME